MNKMLGVLVFAGLGAVSMAGYTTEPVEDKLELKDGSTLYLRPDGTSRMVDHHGKPMEMADGVEMELVDGRKVVMKNKFVWITYGPPGKGGVIRKSE